MSTLFLQVFCSSSKTVMIPSSHTSSDVILKDLILVRTYCLNTTFIISQSLRVSIWASLTGSAAQGLTRSQSRGQSGPWSYGGLTGEASPSKLPWLLATFSPFQIVGLGAFVSCWVLLEMPSLPCPQGPHWKAAHSIAACFFTASKGGTSLSKTDILILCLTQSFVPLLWLF